MCPLSSTTYSPIMKRGKTAAIVASNININININPQSQCPIFNLPPELRNYIWELALAVPVTPVKRGTAKVQLSKAHISRRSSVLSLLQTCRLINNDAYGLFYSNHHLEVGSTYRGPRDIIASALLSECFNALGSRRLSAIEELTLVVEEVEEVTFALRISRRYDSLKHLCLSWAFKQDDKAVLLYRHWPKAIREGLVRERPFIRKVIYSISETLHTVELRFSRYRHSGKYMLANLVAPPDADFDELESEFSEMFSAFLKSRPER